MFSLKKLFLLVLLPLSFAVSAQTAVGTITTGSATCTFTTTVCAGEVVHLNPDNTGSAYKNYHWYSSSVAAGNEITAITAASFNVDTTNFATNFPNINVTGAGTFILTADYSSGTSCAAKNDVFTINYNPLPIATTASATLCETTAGVGTAAFTLTSLDSTINGSASGVTVSYHANLADAKSGSNALASPYTSATTTLYARIVNNTTGCYNTTPVALTVNPLPSVTAPLNQTICAGASTTAINFGGSAVTGTTYAWTNNTTSIGLATSGTGDIASFATTNAGTSPVTATITVTPTANGCPGTPQTFTITVNPTPTVTTPSNQTLCAGASTTLITFGGSAVTSTTYAWTNNTTSIGLAASGAGDIASFATTNPGTSPVTATITVTPTANGCTGTPQTFTITVNPLPDFTLTKPAACPGSTESVVIGGLVNVTTSDLVAVDGGAYGAYPGGGTISGLSIAAHTITLKNTNGCSTTKSVTINAAAAATCIPVAITKN